MDTFFAIGVTGPILELGVLLLLLRNGLWRRYKFLLTYTLWLVVGNSAIIFTFLYFHRQIDSHPIYATLYWDIDSIDVVLRFLLIWEVFHHTFPRGSGLNRSFSKGLGIVAFGLLVFACATFWGYQNYASDRSVHLALDRSFRLCPSHYDSRDAADGSLLWRELWAKRSRDSTCLWRLGIAFDGE